MEHNTIQELKQKIENLENALQAVKTRPQNMSNNVDKLFEALSKVWLEIKDPIKTSSAYQHKYAKLDEYLNAIRPILGKHGLAVTQQIIQTRPDLGPFLVTVLGHESGQWIRSSMIIDIEKYRGKQDKSLIQQLGGIITYLRRYTIAPIVGITHKEDDNIE